MGYIVKRKEALEIRKSKQWLMVYGRRKTGKTFMLRQLCGFKNYILVKKDRNILIQDETKSLDEAVILIKKLLREGESVVLDEFQRLDEAVLEEFMLEHPKGRFILSGSSMKVVKKMFSAQSALLGFFTPMKVGLIDAKDMFLVDFPEDMNIELASFLREAWLIPLYNGEDIVRFVYKVVMQSKYIISALIGEIFSEEERELSRRYEALLRLIGKGVWKTNELANILYARGIIASPSATHIIQYIKNLEEMELIESVRVNRAKNRYFYRLRSPIMNIYYYLEDRYDISNREISFNELKPTLEKLINFEIQNFIADLFANKYEGRKEYFVAADKEIDFIITQRNKAIIVGEVKWKKLVSKDIEKFKRNSDVFSCKKVIIGKKGIKSKNVRDSSTTVGTLFTPNVEVFDRERIVEMF